MLLLPLVHADLWFVRMWSVACDSVITGDSCSSLITYISWNNGRLHSLFSTSSDFTIKEVDAQRAINSNASKRKGHKELFIFNYPPRGKNASNCFWYIGMEGWYCCQKTLKGNHQHIDSIVIYAEKIITKRRNIKMAVLFVEAKIFLWDVMSVET